MDTKQKQILAVAGVGALGLILFTSGTKGLEIGGGELWKDPGASPLGFIPEFFEEGGTKTAELGLPKSSEISKIIKSLPAKESFTGFAAPFGNEQTPSYSISPIEFFEVPDVPDIKTIPKKNMPVIKPLSESTIPVIKPESKKETPAILKKIGISAGRGVAQTLFPTTSTIGQSLLSALQMIGVKPRSTTEMAAATVAAGSTASYDSLIAGLGATKVRAGAPYKATNYDTKKAAAARSDISTWTQQKTYESHGAPYIGADYTSKKAGAARQDVSTWTQVSTPIKETKKTTLKSGVGASKKAIVSSGRSSTSRRVSYGKGMR